LIELIDDYTRVRVFARARAHTVPPALLSALEMHLLSQHLQICLHSIYIDSFSSIKKITNVQVTYHRDQQRCLYTAAAQSMRSAKDVRAYITNGCRLTPETQARFAAAWQPRRLTNDSLKVAPISSSSVTSTRLTRH